MRFFQVLLVISIVLISAVAWRYWQNNEQPQRPKNAPAVVLHKTALGQLQETLDALGTTQAIESIQVTSTLTERITGIEMTEGATVKAGDLLFVLEHNEELAQLKAANIELAEHRRELARIKDLVRQKQIPESELDQRQSLIELALARRLQVEAQINERHIRAPFDGVLGLRSASLGALASPNSPLTTLDSIELLHVDFTVPEKHLNDLKAGQKISATSAAFPEQTFTGTVKTIAPRIDAVSRAVNIRAQIENRSLALKPGMLLNLTLIQSSRQALLIPEEAILMRGSEHFVYVINSDNTAIETPITIGQRLKGSAEVLSGLEPQQDIVHFGMLKVRPNSKVKPSQESWRNNASSNEA